MILDWMRTTVLLITLAIAVRQDLRSRRIPNELIVPAAMAALFLAMMLDGGIGLWQTLFGGLLGFLCFLPLYLLRVMGAGDVKLMTVVGMLVGPGRIIPVLLAVFVAGGVLALGVALREHAVGRLLGNLRGMGWKILLRLAGHAESADEKPRQSVGQMPYAVAIAAGTLFWVFAGTS